MHTIRMPMQCLLKFAYALPGITYQPNDCCQWNAIYRVFHPSCHPLISLCARIKKNPELATTKNSRVQNMPYLKIKWQSPELGNPKHTKFWTLPFIGGGKFWIYFSILAQGENRGWQERRNTLYLTVMQYAWQLDILASLIEGNLSTNSNAFQYLPLPNFPMCQNQEK